MILRPHRRAILRGGLSWGAVVFVGGTEALVEHLCAQPLVRPGAARRAGRSGPASRRIARSKRRSVRWSAVVDSMRVSSPTCRRFSPRSSSHPPPRCSCARPSPRRFDDPQHLVDQRQRVCAVNPRHRTPPARCAADGCASDRVFRQCRPRQLRVDERHGLDGVPIARLVTELGVKAGASGLLISGIDEPHQTSRSSNPGASWILPLDRLERLGAFLAVTMNGEPLQPTTAPRFDSSFRAGTAAAGSSGSTNCGWLAPTKSRHRR